MTLSFRVDERDVDLIKKYAEIKGISVSDLIRQTVLSKIEDEFDLQAFDRAYAAHQANPVTWSLDDLEKELGFA